MTVPIWQMCNINRYPDIQHVCIAKKHASSTVEKFSIEYSTQTHSLMDLCMWKPLNMQNNL